jgi:hypothetical protein
MVNKTLPDSKIVILLAFESSQKLLQSIINCIELLATPRKPYKVRPKENSS